MNMLLYILISVMALGGSEWPTATRPRFWQQAWSLEPSGSDRLNGLQLLWWWLLLPLDE